MELEDVLLAIDATYTWPGGYPMYAICKDLSVLCMDCCQLERDRIIQAYTCKDNDQWLITKIAVNYEDSLLFCDCCYQPIEAAYNVI